MRYLTINHDSSIAVITVFPIGAVRKIDGYHYSILGQRRVDPIKGDPSKCIIYGAGQNGEGMEFIVGDGAYDIADLDVNTVDGYNLIFPDIEKDILSKWTPESRSQVKRTTIVHKSDIPSDRTFRDAWEHNGTALAVNMGKAREIHKNKMRAVRNDLLIKLDSAYMRADEKGDMQEKKKVAERKQQLRDITNHPDIETAQTPDQLKAVWPSILNTAEPGS